MTVLATKRLTLRIPEPRDLEPFVGFVSRDRSKWVGGPGPRADAAEGFNENLTHWQDHGFGYFHVEVTLTGDAIGRVGLRRSGHRPEPEIAYSLYADEHQGHGYATEAAIAVRDWAYDVLGLDTVVSYVDPANQPSRAVAERMGARPDGTAEGWGKHPDLIVYRHLAPAART